MAHLKLMKMSDLRKVTREEFRELENYKNKVDLSKSSENIYAFAETSHEALDRVNTRIKEVMGDRKVRKDCNVVGSWVVSLPKELEGLKPEEKQLFFEDTLEFLGDRYGLENIGFAVIHTDETNWHMHCGIVPVCKSRKNGKETVSSASLFTRKDLSTFHDDYDEFIYTRYGQRGLVHNGRTKGDYTLDELNERDRRERELVERERELIEREQAFQQLTARVKDKYMNIVDVAEKLDELVADTPDFYAPREQAMVKFMERKGIYLEFEQQIRRRREVADRVQGVVNNGFDGIEY